MKKSVLSLLIILAACSAKQDVTSQTAFHCQSDQKLKQKAIVLQKKLSKAERTLSEDQHTIDRIRSQLYEAELNAIESKLEILEKKWNANPERLLQSLHYNVSNLFIEERETLIRLIQRGPETLRAQVLLDRVLQIITQLSDSLETAKK